MPCQVNQIYMYLQSWTKALETNLLFVAFAHMPNRNKTSPTQPCLPPSHTVQCWKLVHEISPNFQHCIGWGGGTASSFQKDSCIFLRLYNYFCYLHCTNLAPEIFYLLWLSTNGKAMFHGSFFCILTYIWEISVTVICPF